MEINLYTDANKFSSVCNFIRIRTQILSFLEMYRFNLLVQFNTRRKNYFYSRNQIDIKFFFGSNFHS
jgi:hypothetical protein